MSTHTYAVLRVSLSTYQEIHDKLKEAGYDSAFHQNGKEIIIDMHGIGLSLNCQHGLHKTPTMKGQ